jgi:hypothetical protein
MRLVPVSSEGSHCWVGREARKIQMSLSATLTPTWMLSEHATFVPKFKNVKTSKISTVTCLLLS